MKQLYCIRKDVEARSEYERIKTCRYVIDDRINMHDSSQVENNNNLLLCMFFISQYVDGWMLYIFSAYVD